MISQEGSFLEKNGAQFVIIVLWIPQSRKFPVTELQFYSLLITVLLITDYQLQNYQILITYLPMSFALPLALPNKHF